MKCLAWLIGLWFAATLVSAQPPANPSPDLPRPVSLQSFQKKAADVFNPDVFTKEDSDLREKADGVLLASQLIAATIIIGGLLAKMRSETRQMEGIAMMLAKVAFIATIPVWQGRIASATDSLAGAIGYTSVTAEDSSPVMNDLWGILQQWAPPSSPAVDALDAQMADNTPASGKEASWSVDAWHWARGVGVADASMFHALWQSASGSVRAFLVFAGCAAMACAVSFVITMTYLAELLRYLLVTGAVALLPIFIAGVGVDALRAHSIRAILVICTITAWPIGWALTNIVSHVIASGTQDWMAEVAQTALTGVSLPAASFAVAAPYVAWATLFLFIGVTAALCVWQLGALFYVPILLARLFSASATTVQTFAGSHVGVSNASTTNMTVVQPSPRPVGAASVSSPVLAARLSRPPVGSVGRVNRLR